MNKCIINVESNDELKENGIKNWTYYYLGYIMKFENFDLDNILIDEKLYKNILVYNILYKNLIGTKLFRIKFEFMMELDI